MAQAAGFRERSYFRQRLRLQPRAGKTLRSADDWVNNAGVEHPLGSPIRFRVNAMLLTPLILTRRRFAIGPCCTPTRDGIECRSGQASMEKAALTLAPRRRLSL